MGNVLIYFDREIFLDRVELHNPEDRELLKKEIYLSLEWAMMDRGTLTDEEAEKIFISRLPEHLHGTVHRLVTNWARPILPVNGMEELVRELKANGYGIYLLSNASYHQHAYWHDIPAWECFDGTLISADERLVKPQPEIFNLLCERYSLQKEECVFIDDTAANAEGAVYAGMQGIVFHDDAKELRQKLRELGINCRS